MSTCTGNLLGVGVKNSILTILLILILHYFIKNTQLTSEGMHRESYVSDDQIKAPASCSKSHDEAKKMLERFAMATVDTDELEKFFGGTSTHNATYEKTDVKGIESFDNVFGTLGAAI